MPLPLLAIGAMAAGGISGYLASRKGRGEKEAADAMRRETGAERTRSQTYDAQAGQSRGRYMDMLDSYDPQQYARQTADAVGEQAMERFNTQDTDRRATLNRRGIFGANIGRGRMEKRFSQNLATQIGTLSMEAGRMQQNKIGQYGDVYDDDRAYADESHGRYLDLLAGGRDYETASRNDRTGAIMGGIGAGARLGAGYMNYRRG